MTRPSDSWERQPDETSAAFAAFAAYRDMGAGRSAAKVGRELGKSRALLNRWSARYGWVARAEAFDRAEDAEWLRVRQERVRESARRNADIAEAAMRRVAQALATLSTSEMDAHGIARLMAAASKLQQLALGQATEHVAVAGPDGGPVRHTYAAMTDEERHERLLELRAEVDRRLVDERAGSRTAAGSASGVGRRNCQTN